MASKKSNFAMSFESTIAIIEQEGFKFTNEELVEIKKAFDPALSLEQINKMEDEMLKKILAKPDAI